MLDTSIQVKTDHFDGPLGLLLLLIQKEEMSIRELNLAKITKQYLDYLGEMKNLNFDEAGEFLFLASTLVLLKSKDCVSEEESARLKDQFKMDGSLNITSQSELIRRLEELHHFQNMGEKLWALPKKGHEIFTKPKVNRKAIVNSILTPMDLQELTNAMMDYIIKENRKYTVVHRDRLSIKEKLRFLRNYLELGQKTELTHLLEKDATEKSEVENTVITFISLLELARLQRVTVFQNEDKSNIYVEVVKSLDDFDIEQANGFEEEGAAEAEAADKELQATIDKNLEAHENNDQLLQ
jgi:segregation and condensation protein A